MTTPRIVVSFSCGAASAVAAKLTLANYPKDRVRIINMEIAEEHSDNRRFLRDCETWFDHPVTVLRNEEYDASIYEVFKRKRFLKQFNFAPCTAELKRKVVNSWYRATDEVVIGYTVEENKRANRFIDANNERVAHFPLIDAGLNKADCLAMVERAGIDLPEMYRLGFNNANCIGCVKGGQAYWWKIKEVFPEQFERMAQMENLLGATLLRHRSGWAKEERMSLRDLQKPKRNISQEPDIECSAFCLMSELITDD